ncbi:MAG: 50S ribosomal protein L29 [bacterium]
MAKKTDENLKEMNVVELEGKLISLQESLRVLKFKTEGSSKVKNVKEAGNLKKQIARVLTEINKK